MSLSFKKGVKVFGLQPEMLWALDRCEEVFTSIIKECVVTSARGDTHSRKSRHYSGVAFDLRSRHLTPAEIDTVRARLIEALGNDYDVLYEKNHFHIEYDPEMKTLYWAERAH